jgi:hypothetical protein
MPLGVNHITPSSAANFIPQQWRSEVRIARKSKFVMKDVAYELPIQGQKGNQFHIPNLSNLVASTKIPGAPVNLLQPNEGEFVLTIDKHKEVSILVEDITEVQEQYYIRSRYTGQMGSAAANALDDDLLALRGTFTQTVAASGVGMTEAKILTAKQGLDEVDTPPDGRVLVIPPAVENDLLSINRFVAADIRQNVSDMIGMGKFIGRIHGFSVMMTNRIKAGDNTRPGAGGGTANTYYSLACHSEASMYGMPRPMNLQSQYKVEYLGTLVVADEIYGVGQYRNDHGVVILSV